MTGDAELITRSFEIAAERCPDLTPLVYRRLFEAHPEMERLFWRDRESFAVRGEMLARVIEAILDFVGERVYAPALIQCEVITHDGYDVPKEVFGTFFAVVADTVRDVVGDASSSDMAAAWSRTLEALAYYVAHPDQFTASSDVGRASSAA